MGNAVARTAGGIFLVNCRAVRFTMAVLASGNLAMRRMTPCTGQAVMQGPVGLKQPISLLVTSAAQSLALRNRVGDHKRRMDRVAGKTIRNIHDHCRTMRVVTFGADRNSAMFL